MSHIGKNTAPEPEPALDEALGDCLEVVFGLSLSFITAQTGALVALQLHTSSGCAADRWRSHSTAPAGTRGASLLAGARV